MTAPEPIFPIGSRVRFSDDVELGDFVYFDHVTQAGLILIRRLAQWEAKSHEGQVYRIDQGADPQRLTIRPVRWGCSSDGAT